MPSRTLAANNLKPFSRLPILFLSSHSGRGVLPTPNIRLDPSWVVAWHVCSCFSLNLRTTILLFPIANETFDRKLFIKAFAQLTLSGRHEFNGEHGAHLVLHLRELECCVSTHRYVVLASR